MAWIEEVVTANEVFVTERKSANIYPRAGERRSYGVMRDRAQGRATRNLHERKAKLGVRPY